MKRLRHALLILGIVLTFGSLTLQAQEDDTLTFVMVSHGGEANPYWKVVIKGMTDACDLLQVECFWYSDPLDNVAEMGNYWNAALALNPDGIGTTVADPEVIRDQVNQAAEMGIPVIAFDTADPNAGTPDALPILFYIGGDEFVSGQKNAEGVLAAAEKSGVSIARGMCTIHEEGNSSLQTRCDGAVNVFEAANIPMDVLNISNDVSESAAMLQEYFDEHPETNAVFLSGFNPVSSFSLYLEASGREPGEIYAATYDVSEEIFQLIQDGYLLQTVDQQPYLQGYQTIMWLYLNHEYKFTPGGDILTGPGIIDASNLADIIELTAEGYR